MDSVDLEQRGPTGSEVSVLTLVEERGVLFCRLVLDVTSVAASCVSHISHISPLCQLSLLDLMAVLFSTLSIRFKWNKWEGSTCLCEIWGLIFVPLLYVYP